MGDGASKIEVDIVARTIRTAQGNAPQQVKDTVAEWWTLYSKKQGFAREVLARLEATELSVYENPETPGKTEGKMVFEMVVTSDMCNYLGAMHGGCTSFLIDICSSMVLNLLAAHSRPEIARHVSLMLNITFHAPGLLGSKLKIINHSVAVGGRAMTVRCEIYDATNGRIVATGTHIKMPPSGPKL